MVYVELGIVHRIVFIHVAIIQNASMSSMNSNAVSVGFLERLSNDSPGVR